MPLQFIVYFRILPQAPHPAGEERSTDGVARPAAAASDRAQERAIRENLQRPHLAVQPDPDTGKFCPLYVGRQKYMVNYKCNTVGELTKFRETLDKYWTFVQPLFNICPVTRSQRALESLHLSEAFTRLRGLPHSFDLIQPYVFKDLI